jgi:hypothetical protein
LILAVSLALMALLVATSRNTSSVDRVLSDATGGSLGGGAHGHASASGPRAGATTTSTTTSTTTTTPSTGPAVGAPGLAAAHGGTTTTTVILPKVTDTTVPATTTTTSPASQSADRTQTQGYLDPPVQTSNTYGFTGTGAMEISVVWSGSVYLTLQVSCANGTQNAGGTGAMAVSLPDATGNCQAIVTEPDTESTALTYTITIGPAGG